MKIILAYLVLSLLINIIAAVLAKFGLNNLPLLHFYTIAELCFVMLFFREIMQPKQVTKWIYTICIFFAVICVLNSLFLQSIYTFNSYTRSLEAILIIGFCITYLSGEEVISTSGIRLFPAAWVSGGLLLYFSSSLIQFVFSNQLLTSAKSVQILIWDIHGVLLLITYLVYTKAIINEAAAG
ncbi:MAG: hypothetical protein V4543_14050 [Bacteroidota bacterium]